MARPDHAALELSPAGQARLRRPADELLGVDRLRRSSSRARSASIRSKGPPTRSTRRPTRRSGVTASSTDRGRLRRAPAMAAISRTGWRRPRRGTRRSSAMPALVNAEAQWGTSDGIYHRELMAGGPPWEQTDDLAQPESDPPRGELQDADAAVGRRKGLPRAAEQHAGDVERPAADESAVTPAGLARRESLDPERREQPRLLPGSARVDRQVADAGDGERREQTGNDLIQPSIVDSEASRTTAATSWIQSCARSRMKSRPSDDEGGGEADEVPVELFRLLGDTQRRARGACRRR